MPIGFITVWGVALMPRETSRARHPRGAAGRLTAFVAPAAITALLSAGALAAHAPSAGTRPGHRAVVSGISTVAGGLGGPAKATHVAITPDCHLAFRGGSLYVADDGAVRRVRARTGWLTNLMGTGSVAPLGDGGPATKATVGACAVAFDHAGNMVVADPGNNRIRVVAARTGTFYGQAMTRGDIYTVAGGGSGGADGVPATEALLFGPSDVAVDRVGNLVIDDRDNLRIRVVAARTGAFYGKAMTAGDIYTVAGRGTLDPLGDGGPGWHAGLAFPDGVIVDRAGNLVIGDSGHSRIRVVAGSTGTFYGQAMTKGDIYTIAGTGTAGFSGDGGPATGAELNGAGTPALDAAGNLVVADSGNERIRVLAESTGTFYGQAMTAGDIYTIAGSGIEGFSGDGGAATGAEFRGPLGVAVDSAGNVVIGDVANHRVRVVAGSTGTFYGQAMTAGDIYTAVGNGSPSFSGGGGPATRAQLSATGVALDGAGNLLIADAANYRVRAVAAASGTFYGRAMTKGDIYTVAGDGTQGFSGDGGPATGAELDSPFAVTVDAVGNLVLSDFDRVRVVAARTGTFYGQAMTAGNIYTVAGNGTRGFSGDGGPAISAELGGPGTVAIDAAGNLVITDTQHNRIRVAADSTGTFYGKPMTAGDIYTVAGDGTQGFAGDGGPATKAMLFNPGSVAVGVPGRLVVADTINERVRVVG
jgi:trimeric autotransporter adhesin